MSKFISPCRGLMTVLLAFILMLTGVQAEAQLLRRSFAQADVKPPEPVAPPADVKPEAPVAPVVPEVVRPDGEAKALAIRISAVQGMVQVRAVETDPWATAKVDMDLTVGSEIRTGLRSICQFKIDNNHTITLDRLGVVKVLDAIVKDGKVKTDVGMKYGRTQYQVETGAAEHDSRVHAPAATLAVRGSFVTLEDNAAFGSVAIVDHSERAIYKQRGPDGSVRVVSVELIRGRIEQGPNDAGKNPPTAAQTALRDTINDVGGRLARASEAERDLIATYPIYNGADATGGASIAQIQDSLPDTIFVPDHDGSGGGGGSTGVFVTGGLSITAIYSTSSQEIALFAIEPTFSGAGGQISSVADNPAGHTTTVRTSNDNGGVAFASSTFSSAIQYLDGVPAGTWEFGIALTNTSTTELIPVQVQVTRLGVGGIGNTLITTLNGELGATGSSETTIKITQTFTVSGTPKTPDTAGRVRK